MALFATVAVVATEPQVMFNERGTARCAFRVREDEVRDERTFTKYWDVSVWGKQAEEISRTLGVGVTVYLEGDARTVKPRQATCGGCGTELKGSWGFEVSARTVRIIAAPAAPQSESERAKERYEDDSIPF